MEGVERKKWVDCVLCRFSVGHKSSDVTNAVNVLACFQYGLPEQAEPVGGWLAVSSPTHLGDLL